MAGLCEGSNEPPGSLKASNQAIKGNIEGGVFDPVLWIKFGVAQRSERLNFNDEGGEQRPVDHSEEKITVGNFDDEIGEQLPVDHTEEKSPSCQLEWSMLKIACLAPRMPNSFSLYRGSWHLIVVNKEEKGQEEIDYVILILLYL
ncbi:hypothetical protein ANN_06903 [Periplaneta americana]|uniref:Uncharacterized protein n=1 Tax=Periplaneta americana TaxID=6978 RepID=A0ABQ8TEY2_PERAM|nr:hypothetical protein ANN_06903 [Periplaneta americana]